MDTTNQEARSEQVQRVMEVYQSQKSADARTAGRIANRLVEAMPQHAAASALLQAALVAQIQGVSGDELKAAIAEAFKCAENWGEKVYEA